MCAIKGKGEGKKTWNKLNIQTLLLEKQRNVRNFPLHSGGFATPTDRNGYFSERRMKSRVVTFSECREYPGPPALRSFHVQHIGGSLHGLDV